MLEKLQQSQLTQSSLGENFVFEGLIDFLDGHKIFLVFGGHDDTIGSLSDWVK